MTPRKQYQPKPVPPQGFDTRRVVLNPFEQWQHNQQQTGVSWFDVDATLLRAALHAALNAGTTLVFSQASGGLGVCLRSWQGEVKNVVYVASAHHLNEVLANVISAYDNGSEDIRVMWGLAGGGAAEELDAD